MMEPNELGGAIYNALCRAGHTDLANKYLISLNKVVQMEKCGVKNYQCTKCGCEHWDEAMPESCDMCGYSFEKPKYDKEDA